MHKKLKDVIFPKGSMIRKVLVNIKQNGIIDTIKKVRSYNLKGNQNNIKAYKEWIIQNEPNETQLEDQRKKIFSNMPKISVVVPLYNTNKIYFEQLVQHMINQTYSNWELCLADGSPEKNISIEKITQKDNRIKYQFLGNNKGIAENTNSAIQLSTGEYIALLDDDDTLADFALYEIIKIINEHPDVEFIYSDEDKITENTEERFSPHFKPDFAIDTLRSVNYICHFSVIKKELLKEVGGLHKEFDGAQDYDLFLRISEKTNKIIHIPKILYHWRSHPGSTSTSEAGNAKLYAYEAGKKALECHLERLGIQGKVFYGTILGTYRISYSIIEKPKVSILIPNKDHVKDLKLCIKSILKNTTYTNYEIVIIENNSIEKSTFKFYSKIQKEKNIRVITYPEKDFNYSKIINFGIINVDSTYILQLNNDTELLTPDWLEQFISYAQRNDVGAVGAKLYYPDNTIQHAGIIIGIKGTAGHILRNLSKHKKAYFGRESFVQNFSSITGACLFSKKSIYEEVGNMDEDFAIAFNDIDFCLKIREKGYLIVCTPYIELKHFESKSRGYETTPEKINRFQKETALFQKKWKKQLQQGDPYFNCNFSLDTEEYQIKGGKEHA